MVLASHPRCAVDQPDLTCAAVLVPLVFRECSAAEAIPECTRGAGESGPVASGDPSGATGPGDEGRPRAEWHVVVTQRSQNVDQHRGQISFPGGACDPEDTSRIGTALREAYEEIGLLPEAVEVLGVLDDLATISQFSVTPVVGVIPYPTDYRLNRTEVEALVEVPLSYLLEPSHLRVEQREHEGRVYEVLFWTYGSYTIWGATARILKGLLDLIT